MLQWPPDVSTGRGCPQVNKFEHVSSIGHQMLLAGEEMEGPCTVRHGHIGPPTSAGQLLNWL